MSASGIAFLAGRLPSVCAWQCSSDGDCVSVAAFYLGACPALRFCCGALPRRMSGDAVLLGRLPSAHVRRCGSVGAPLLGAYPAMRFFWGALLSVHVQLCGSVAVLCLGSRLLFAAWRQTGRLAVACVPIPRVEIAICTFSRCSSVICLCGFTSGWAFLYGDLDGVPGMRGTENGKRN